MRFAAARWLPGQLARATATGGTDQVPLGTAVLTALAYIVVFWVVATVDFLRRDVTA